MKKILVAYDGTTGAEAALLSLAKAGLPAQAEAKVLCVADVWAPPDSLKNLPDLPDVVSPSREKARLAAKDALLQAHDIAKQGVTLLAGILPFWKIQPSARADSPAWAILREAKKWGADLIVLGSHGRSALHRFFLGSISSKVAAEAACSTRIYRPHDGGPNPTQRIIVAVDGSHDSEAAVAEVATRHWGEGDKFQVMTVIDPKLATASAWPKVFPEDWSHPTDESTEWATRMAFHYAELLRHRGLDTEVHVFDGDPKKRLLDHAESWNADCIFLGARGLEHGERLYLGTFASAILMRAHCTVEVVRPAKQEVHV